MHSPRGGGVAGALPGLEGQLSRVGRELGAAVGIGPRRDPLGRLGQADEVAYMILFLLSDESTFSTGSEFVCDGGLTA